MIFLKVQMEKHSQMNVKSDLFHVKEEKTISLDTQVLVNLEEGQGTFKILIKISKVIR